MEFPKIFESEYRFCLILWEHEPVLTTDLVRLCHAKLEDGNAPPLTPSSNGWETGESWENNAGTVASRISKEDAQMSEIDQLVEKKFQGSVPAFIAAFARRQELSDDEIEEIRRIIEK